ncbi:hypothetical protein [Clostridium porci]|uniref:Uncharacterized protein n=1 Tax=Clostridium porci TaxID=2605778 RepID=A0A7X2TE53_9CLOT|nr:hypothetical protein [Clostridium porci]MSS38739.1 hypothetical protein [Clostridium porci]
MKKRLLLAATAVMSMAMSMTAFAGMGSWQQNATGWWWQRTDNSYPASEWKWIDGNGDGTVESYYFDGNGYLITNTTTPDGYTVNADGAWVQDGVVQKRQVMLDLGDEVLTTQTATQTNTTTGNPVMDGKSIEKIVVNPEIMGMMGAGGVDRLPNKTEIGQGIWGPTYNVDYNGVTLKVETDNRENWVSSFYGPAKVLFNNIPSQGIELNAFYDNSGYESLSAGRQPMASTGNSDTVFGLPTGSYRMAWGSVQGRGFSILLTPGLNDTWYIYPDSPTFLYN